MTPCTLIGAPVQNGAGRRGCNMGPDAYRAAGIAEMLAECGFHPIDRGNLQPRPFPVPPHPNPAIRGLPEFAAWTAALADAVHDATAHGIAITLGGDHSLAAGTLAGAAMRAAAENRPLFVLWLDSHPDFHTLDTTVSGNLHGVPVAYAAGQPGFAGFMPPLPHPVPPGNICMVGLRSVDPPERMMLAEAGVVVHDMRALDETGIAAPVRAFLDRVAAAGGRLHVSLDVDFLDPGIAPGVGTTVPGGATFREAHLAMELVHDSGLAGSLDLAELNPFMDERGRTALLMVDLAASLLGRRIFDRPTRSV